MQQQEEQLKMEEEKRRVLALERRRNEEERRRNEEEMRRIEEQRMRPQPTPTTPPQLGLVNPELENQRQMAMAMGVMQGMAQSSTGPSLLEVHQALQRRLADLEQITHTRRTSC